MKKFDWTIWIGILGGAAAITGAAWFEGLDLAFLWNPSAALVVFGGTVSAVVVRRGLGGVGSAIRSVLKLHLKPDNGEEHRIKIARLAWLARAAKKHGPKTYEGLANEIDDVLIANGFVLLAENASPEQMKEALTSRITTEYRDGQKDIRTLEAAGGFAPTFGILGAVIGLATVLQVVNNPAALGSGIASAFVATMYGIALANLLLFPLASRLKSRHLENMERREEVASVMLSLLDRETPRAIINQFNLMK